ncbi:hypothetical protein [Rhizobium etli]|nr:hypothetical protein [Rhizobium sp. IE4771]
MSITRTRGEPKVRKVGTYKLKLCGGPVFGASEAYDKSGRLMTPHPT